MLLDLRVRNILCDIKKSLVVCELRTRIARDIGLLEKLKEDSSLGTWSETGKHHVSRLCRV